MKISFLAPKTPYPTCKAALAHACCLLAEAKKHGAVLAYWVAYPSEVRHGDFLCASCKDGSVRPVYLNRASAGFRGVQSLLHGRSYSEGYVGSALNDYSNQDAVKHFVNEIVPRVKQQCPKTRLRIVGRAPARVARWLAHGIAVAQRLSWKAVGEKLAGVENLTTPSVRERSSFFEANLEAC